MGLVSSSPLPVFLEKSKPSSAFQLRRLSIVTRIANQPSQASNNRSGSSPSPIFLTNFNKSSLCRHQQSNSNHGFVEVGGGGIDDGVGAAGGGEEEALGGVDRGQVGLGGG
ncbi:unnamed protein product [Linum trigynum]|uniref:Uncharacterized protein n=1 Tax=Linum trigynum TaxID=586398 RepID=A0AAV2EUU0_9ROSI